MEGWNSSIWHAKQILKISKIWAEFEAVFNLGLDIGERINECKAQC